MFVPEPEFSSLAQYNEALLHLCKADWQREHYRHNQLITELYQEDQQELHAFPHITFDPATYRRYKTDAYGIVTINSIHRYSSSPKFARQYVQLKFTAEQVTVLDESYRPVVAHKRLYGKMKGERINWLPYLHQLSRRPGALKYTPIYEMMPQSLQHWINLQPKAHVGTTLSLIAALTEKGSFHSACTAISDSIVQGITDNDSLVALHDRMTNTIPVLPEQKTKHSVQTPVMVFNPESYDRMLSGARK